MRTGIWIASLAVAVSSVAGCDDADYQPYNEAQKSEATAHDHDDDHGAHVKNAPAEHADADHKHDEHRDADPGDKDHAHEAAKAK